MSYYGSYTKSFEDHFDLTESQNALFCGFSTLGGEDRLLDCVATTFVRHFVASYGGNVDDLDAPLCLQSFKGTVQGMDALYNEAGAHIHNYVDHPLKTTLRAAEPCKNVAIRSMTIEANYFDVGPSAVHEQQMNFTMDLRGVVVGHNASYISPRDFILMLRTHLTTMRSRNMYPSYYTLVRNSECDPYSPHRDIRPCREIRMAEMGIALDVNTKFKVRNSTVGDTAGTSTTHWDKNPLTGRILEFKDVHPLIRADVVQRGKFATHLEQTQNLGRLMALSRFEPAFDADEGRQTSPFSHDPRGAGFISCARLNSSRSVFVQDLRDPEQIIERVPTAPSRIWSNVTGSSAVNIPPGGSHVVQRRFEFEGSLKTFMKSFGYRYNYGINSQHMVVPPEEWQWRTVPKLGSAVLFGLDRVYKGLVVPDEQGALATNLRPISVRIQKETKYSCDVSNAPTVKSVIKSGDHERRMFETMLGIKSVAQYAAAVKAGINIKMTDAVGAATRALFDAATVPYITGVSVDTTTGDMHVGNSTSQGIKRPVSDQHRAGPPTDTLTIADSTGLTQLASIVVGEANEAFSTLGPEVYYSSYDYNRAEQLRSVVRRLDFGSGRALLDTDDGGDDPGPMVVPTITRSECGFHGNRLTVATDTTEFTGVLKISFGVVCLGYDTLHRHATLNFDKGSNKAYHDFTPHLGSDPRYFDGALPIRIHVFVYPVSNVPMLFNPHITTSPYFDWAAATPTKYDVINSVLFSHNTGTTPSHLYYRETVGNSYIYDYARLSDNNISNSESSIQYDYVVNQWSDYGTALPNNIIRIPGGKIRFGSPTWVYEFIDPYMEY